MNVARVISLSHQHDRQDLQRLADKYRAWRLHALKTDPEVFAATYQDESERENHYWFDRLSNAKATHLFAIESRLDDPSSSTTDVALSAVWKGSLVLLGPQHDETDILPKADPFAVMTSSSINPDAKTSSSHNQALHYHLNGMYVLPEARGGGLAKALLERALRRIEEQGKAQQRSVVCTVIVYEINTAAFRLYSSAGFEVVERQIDSKKIFEDSEYWYVDRNVVVMSRNS